MYSATVKIGNIGLTVAKVMLLIPMLAILPICLFIVAICFLYGFIYGPNKADRGW